MDRGATLVKSVQLRGDSSKQPSVGLDIPSRFSSRLVGRDTDSSLTSTFTTRGSMCFVKQANYCYFLFCLLYFDIDIVSHYLHSYINWKRILKGFTCFWQEVSYNMNFIGIKAAEIVGSNSIVFLISRQKGEKQIPDNIHVSQTHTHFKP